MDYEVNLIFLAIMGQFFERVETYLKFSSRKAIVNRLIQLQIRHEDLREKQELSAITFETRGHTFVNYSHGIKIPGKQGFLYCTWTEHV